MIRQTVWGQCRIKTLLCLAWSLKALIKFDQSFFLWTQRHHLLGEAVDDFCSTGQASKQCTRSDGVERVNSSSSAFPAMLDLQSGE